MTFSLSLMQCAAVRIQSGLIKRSTAEELGIVISTIQAYLPGPLSVKRICTPDNTALRNRRSTIPPRNEIARILEVYKKKTYDSGWWISFFSLPICLTLYQYRKENFNVRNSKMIWWWISQLLKLVVHKCGDQSCLHSGSSGAEQTTRTCMQRNRNPFMVRATTKTTSRNMGAGNIFVSKWQLDEAYVTCSLSPLCDRRTVAGCILGRVQDGTYHMVDKSDRCPVFPDGLWTCIMFFQIDKMPSLPMNTGKFKALIMFYKLYMLLLLYSFYYSYCFLRFNEGLNKQNNQLRQLRKGLPF